jgi:four helix bundle protein
MIELYQWSMVYIPKELQYDIGSDMRRAARSIPSNIAEGYGRQKSNRDTINFLKTSMGSNDEVLFNLEVLHDLQLMDDEKYNHFRSEYKRIGTGLWKLIDQSNSV